MAIHRCGTPEFDQTPGALVRWPQNEITYFEALTFQGMDRPAVMAAYDRACAQWAAVAGVTFRRLASPAGANIVAVNGPIDGPYGILAQSDLPVGASAASTMNQLFDAAEPWYMEPDGMLLGCMCHEIGHALGMGHIPDAGALLDPYIVPGRFSPQAPDVRDIQGRYGPPLVVPAAGHPDVFLALGVGLAPFVLGPMADGLVEAAKRIEAGTSPAEADLAWRAKAGMTRDVVWERLAAPKLAGLNPTARAAGLRAIAAGLASKIPA